MTSREFFQWSGGGGVNVAQTIRWTVGAVFLMQNAMTAKLESGVAPCVRIISGSKDISFPEPDASTPLPSTFLDPSERDNYLMQGYLATALHCQYPIE